MLGLCPVVFGRFATVCVKFESCPFKLDNPYGLVDFREDLVAVRGVVENFLFLGLLSCSFKSMFCLILR